MNDCILIISLHDGNLKHEFIQGKPLMIDYSLGIYEQGGLMMNYQKAIEYMRKESHRQTVNSEGQDAYIIAISAMNELQQYKQLGTLEEVREAVEKQRAISREIIEGKYFCPKCHNLMPYPGYCGCGQKLY